MYTFKVHMHLWLYMLNGTNRENKTLILMTVSRAVRKLDKWTIVFSYDYFDMPKNVHIRYCSVQNLSFIGQKTMREINFMCNGIQLCLILSETLIRFLFVYLYHQVLCYRVPYFYFRSWLLTYGPNASPIVGFIFCLQLIRIAIEIAYIKKQFTSIDHFALI